MDVVNRGRALRKALAHGHQFDGSGQRQGCGSRHTAEFAIYGPTLCTSGHLFCTQYGTQLVRRRTFLVFWRRWHHAGALTWRHTQPPLQAWYYGLAGGRGRWVPFFTHRFRQSRPGLFGVDFNPARWTIDTDGGMVVKCLDGARDRFFAVTAGHPADRE